MLTFQLGIYSVDLLASMRFVSPYIYPVAVWSKYRWELSVMHLKIFLLKDHLLKSYDLGSVKFIIMKFIWQHGFHILVRVFFMIGQNAPCWDQINKIIWVAHFIAKVVRNSLFYTKINRSGASTSPLFIAGDRDVGNQYQIYLICIFVVNGGWAFKNLKVTGKRDKWDFPLRFEWGYISARSKND